jgi:hypothetical protein
MKNILLSLFLLTVTLHAEAQSRFTKTYKFGDYTVHTDYRKASIRISRGSQTIYYDGSGDGAGYEYIDTMTLNADNVPDFVFVYPMEEYAVIGLLVSIPTKPFYKSIDLADLFDPYDYDTTIRRAKDATLKELVLVDVNKDGKRDLLTNVLKKNGKLYPIKNWTDTFYNKQLRQIANGTPYKTKSNAVFLDQ